MGNQTLSMQRIIIIEERISTLSTMVRKSVHDFHAQMKKYTTELYRTN